MALGATVTLFFIVSDELSTINVSLSYTEIDTFAGNRIPLVWLNVYRDLNVTSGYESI